MRHAFLLSSVLVALALIPPAAHAGALPDLGIIKTASVMTGMVGDEITWTLVVTNTGGVTASGVTLTDRIPDSLDRISVMTDAGTCMDGEPITCMLGDVAVGATVTVTIVTRANAEGRINNMAGVIGSTADVSSANNQDDAFVDVMGLGMPDAGVLPDGAVPGDAGMMMEEESDDGCGCVIPAGGPKSPGSVLTILGLLVACVMSQRRVSRFRSCRHSSNGWQRRSE